MEQQKIAKSTMTSQEAAEYIGVSLSTLRKYVHENGLPITCFPGRRKWLFKKGLIDQWLEENSKPVTYVYQQPIDSFSTLPNSKQKKGYGELRILQP